MSSAFNVLIIFCKGSGMVKKFVLVFSLLIFSSIIYPQSKNNYKLLGGVVDSTLGTGLTGANVTVISRANGKTITQTTF
ncbi:MAG: hypothetical protein COT22_03310, partial [Ignavibacteria bacterium CG08_land_8_20_14_0_20_37_9]